MLDHTTTASARVIARALGCDYHAQGSAAVMDLAPCYGVSLTVRGDRVDVSIVRAGRKTMELIELVRDYLGAPLQ